MYENAIIIDAYSHGSYHEVINQSYVMMISSLYENVTYIAEESSCENLKRLMRECDYDFSNVNFEYKDFKSFFFKTSKPSVDYLQKIFFVSWYHYRYYMATPKGTDVFYNGNLFGAILGVNFFSFGKKNPLYIMCHNEMEWIDKKSLNGLAPKVIHSLLSFCFRKVKLKAKFHFILLSSWMENYFKGLISEKNRKLILSIDHAYIRPQNRFNGRITLENKFFKIGIPAAINDSRGLPFLKKILKQNIHQNVKIYSLSSVSENVENENFEVVNKTGGLLPFEQYNKAVQEMDALLFLYDNDSYKLTASGAILEAIWNEKPIIALHNHYFDYIFEKYGQMGYLCDSEDDLVRKINELCLNNYNLDVFAKNIKKAKELLHPKEVACQLRNLIEN